MVENATERHAKTGPAPERRVPGDAARCVDLVLDGFLRVRLIGAQGPDISAVARQLGFEQKPSERDPDLVVRFSSNPPGAGPMGFIGVTGAAYSADGFFVTKRVQGRLMWLMIPFERLGRHMDLECSVGIGSIPLLGPLIGLAALANGAVPLHSSAFLLKEKGVVAAGFAHSGKTELLLGAMARGARHVSDDWVFVSADGARMAGTLEPVLLWPEHLRQLETLRKGLGPGAAMRVPAFSLMETLVRSLLDNRAGRALVSQQVVDRLGTGLRSRSAVKVPPRRLFGEEACLAEAPLNVLLLMSPWDRQEVQVRPLSGRDFARRMTQAILHEWSELFLAYGRFRFAFPDRRCELLEQAPSLLADCMETAFGAKRAFDVRHPYGGSIHTLTAEVEKAIGSTQP